MRKIAEVTSRFPESELAIHRAWAMDLQFREICENYALAIEAHRFWQAPGRADAAKVGEYQRLAEEIENEIRAVLDMPHGKPIAR